MNIIYKIKEIIQLEKDIACLYSRLYELELQGDKEYEIYLKFHEELKIKLEEEEKIFDSLSDEEIFKILIYFRLTFELRRVNGIYLGYSCETFETYANTQPSTFERLLDSDDIDASINKMEQIITCIIANNIKDQYTLRMICVGIENFAEKRTIINCDEKDEFLRETNEGMLLSRNLFKEYDIVYLTFLDEYIRNASDEKQRIQLLSDKYDFVHMHRMTIIEGHLIEKASVSNDKDKYFSKRSSFCMHNAVECIRTLYVRCSLDIGFIDANISRINEIGEFLKLRSYCLLMDDNTFNDFISEWFSSEELISILNSTLSTDVIDTLKKDRERRKTLLKKYETQ